MRRLVDSLGSRSKTAYAYVPAIGLALAVPLYLVGVGLLVATLSDPRTLVEDVARTTALAQKAFQNVSESLVQTNRTQVTGALVRRYGHFDTAEDAVRTAPPSAPSGRKRRRSSESQAARFTSSTSWNPFPTRRPRKPLVTSTPFKS